MLHSPVLLEESIDFLITNPSGKYIDATFGRGGHSRKILDSISKDGELLALDKDIEAIRFAEENFKDNNFSIQHVGFEVIKEFKVIAKKIKPSASELQRNKRSRSAIMRVFEKI